MELGGQGRVRKSLPTKRAKRAATPIFQMPTKLIIQVEQKYFLKLEK